MVKLRPSTAADVLALYGRVLPYSVQGVTGTDGERVLGMGAIYPHDGCMLLICRIADDARPQLKKHALTMLKGARALLKMASAHRMPVCAVVDRRFPRAVALLEHLGFRHIEKDVYEWTTPA